MGVRGLASLLETHPRIYRDVRLRNRRLVIDGCNFLYLLYFDSGLDLIRGGEYAAFEAVVERFVRTLRDCGVSPYVVLDGGKDLTDKKDETVRQRFVEKIQRACSAAEENRQEKVLPRLANLVFRQTLARLGVPVAQCYAEADWEIAALAKEWECPVLSNDSDFFICELPGGLLPLSHFRWQDAVMKGPRSSIPCRIYHRSAFCVVFQIQPQLLPAFASLAGNDYMKLERMDAAVDWARFAPAVNGTPPHYLVGLLHWLKKFRRPEEAFEAALGLMGDLSPEKREEVTKGLNLGMKDYQLPPSSLKKFFVHGVAPPYPEAEEMDAGWTLRPLMEGRMTSDILDVLLRDSITLNPSVDRKDLPSANLTSRPIRQVMYRLLLGQDEDVHEHDREGLGVKSFVVKPDASGVALGLKLQTLNKEESSVRLQVLLEALGVSQDSLDRLQPHLRLLVATTCFWLKWAEPKPDKTLLKALLVGASHGDWIRKRADKTPFRQRLDTDVLHSINQWQACLQHSVYLNQLLGCPLPEPQVARCYEGSLVHRLVQMLRADQKLRPFPQSDPSCMREYHCMFAVTHRFCPKDVLTMSEAPRPKLDPVPDMSSTLKDLVLQCPEDEEDEVGAEDLHHDDVLSVKTRYRAKQRSGRCSSLIVARKQERRGRDVF